MSEQAYRTALAIGLLVGLTLVVVTYARLNTRGQVLVAAVRALVQLVGVAIVIAWIYSHPQWAVVYLIVMVLAASYTASRRIGGGVQDLPAVLISITAGATATIGVVTATGAIAFSTQTMLPFAAQMIGGAMSAASVAGLRLRDDVSAQRDLFEGYIALGATSRQAARDFARHASERALFPSIDQTKSAGLVTLPGAFVGLLIGGATPLVAAQIQLLVLVGLMLAQTITAVMTTRLIAPIPGQLGAVSETPHAARPRDWNESEVFRLDGVSITYGHVPAVRGASLSIGDRAVTAFIGPSGAGKSTLLRSLNRMNDLAHAQLAGSVRYRGREVYAPDVDVRLLRQRVGMVFQRPIVFPMSVFDNVAFGPRLHGRTDGLDALVAECLHRVGLWAEVLGRLEDDASSLSLGQQQRLVIARCLALGPDVILMDEPTASLDPRATETIERLIVDLSREHAVVLVSHNLRQVAEIADATAFFDRTSQDEPSGVLVEFGTTAQVLESPQDQRTIDYLAHGRRP